MYSSALQTTFGHGCKHYAGADPGFLESGFICIKVWGVHFAFIFRQSKDNNFSTADGILMKLHMHHHTMVI